ncbi:MAG: KEOPS complex subunit Pcc1 [Candidatus Saliniplasma sp.]
MKSAYIRLPESERTKASMESLVPEAQEGMRRVNVKLDFDSDEIQIEAEDTRALRAAVNSYLRWLEVSNEIWNDIN